MLTEVVEKIVDVPQAIEEEQPPVSLRFGPCPPVEEVHQLVKIKLIFCPYIGGGSEEGEVFFFVDILQPSILDGVRLTFVDQS
jgi:hypothetical protein